MKGLKRKKKKKKGKSYKKSLDDKENKAAIEFKPPRSCAKSSSVLKRKNRFRKKVREKRKKKT